MEVQQKDGYVFKVNENLHTVFVKKEGEIVGAFSPSELKNLGVI